MAVIREHDRQIAARVRKVRYANQLSQPEFAKKLDLTVDQEANIEYCRTPLTVEIADKLSERFDVNLNWLAEGVGAMNPMAGLIGNEAPSIKAGTALSKAWNTDIGKRIRDSIEFRSFERESLLSGGRAILPEVKAHRYFDQFLQDAKAVFIQLNHAQREQLLNNFAYALGMLTIESILQKETGETIFANSEGAKSGVKHLTSVHASVKQESVKPQWPLLKQRLQKATAQSGGKSKLAEFLQAKLASVSQWLTDSDNAREPGAETALRMLKWVEQQERK